MKKIPAQDKFDINALAIQRGQEFNIPRRKDESLDNYRIRIAGELRQQGHYIEAHEANSGRLYNDPEQGQFGPMAGIIGIVAQKMQGIEYSPHDPQRQIGDDIAAGIVAQHGRDKKDSSLVAIFSLLGPEAGMDFIEATRRDRK